MQAIVTKELRENLRLLPVGLLLVSASVLSVTPIRLSFGGGFGAVSSQLMAMSSMAAGVFAILLGAAQAWFDLGQSQRGFLFHRPFTRNQILYGKVIAAAILYACAYVVPLTCVALWFAYSGPLYFPVRPAQVLPALIMCTFCFVLHPITIFTIEREARWLGTRLFPLLGTVCVLFVFSTTVLSIREAWYPIAVISAVAFALFASLTLIANHPSRRWIVGLGAFTTVIVSIGFAASCLVSLLDNPANTQATYPRTAMDDSGNLWSYRYNSITSTNGYQVTEVAISGEQLRANSKPDLDRPLPKDFTPHNLSMLSDIAAIKGQDPFINFSRNRSPDTMLSDSRGAILVYDHMQTPPFKGTITRNGFHRRGELVSGQFSIEPAMLTFPSSSSLSKQGINILDWLLADFHGIYQFNHQTATIETLVEMRIQHAAILLDSLESGYYLLVQSGEKLHLFALDDTLGDNHWFKARKTDSDQALNKDADPTLDIPTNGGLPTLTMRKLHTYPALPAELGGNYPGFGLTKSGKLVVATQWGGQSFFASVTGDENSVWEVSTYIGPQAAQQSRVIGAIALLPFGLFLFAFAVISLRDLTNGRSLNSVFTQLLLPQGESLTLFCTLVLIATAASAGITIHLCRRRGLSIAATLARGLAALLLGIAGPLSILALYSPRSFEACPRCNQRRRIDRATCEHCSSHWEPLPTQGIEIVDRCANFLRAYDKAIHR